MSLQSILDIVVEMVSTEERRGLDLAEQIYKLCGSPTERRQLAMALETILTELVRKKVRYPKFIFKRLKQLQRGDWRPPEPIAASQPPAAGTAPHRAFYHCFPCHKTFRTEAEFAAHQCGKAAAG